MRHGHAETSVGTWSSICSVAHASLANEMFLLILDVLPVSSTGVQIDHAATGDKYSRTFHVDAKNRTVVEAKVRQY